MERAYTLIHDEDQVSEFADIFGQGLSLCYLSARRKWAPEMDGDSECFHRKTFTGSSALIRCIEEYQGTTIPYKTHRGGDVVQEGLGVYSSLNTRNHMTAGRTLCHELLDSLLSGNESKVLKTGSRWMSFLQHHDASSKNYIVLDVDTKDQYTYQRVNNKLDAFGVDPVCTIETHGGYHIVLERRSLSSYDGDNRAHTLGRWIHKELPEWKQESTDIHGNVCEKQMVDILSDPYSPIPGTIQGGFEVKFVRLLR